MIAGPTRHRRKSAAAGVPGYVEGEIPSGVEHPPGDPASGLASATSRIMAFVAARDSLNLLARSGLQFLLENAIHDGPGGARPKSIEQAQLELLQAIVVSIGPGKPVPTSPANMVRAWKLLSLGLDAYVHSIEPSGPDRFEAADTAHRVRLMTVNYRNIFNSADATEIVPALLTRMDRPSKAVLGYALSDFARALFALFHDFEGRLDRHRGRVRALLLGDGSIEDEIAGIRRDSFVADRAWRFADERFEQRSEMGAAAFQLSELACTELFTFGREDLEERFGPEVTAALFRCAIPLGSLTGAELERVHIDNPVWSRPFVSLGERRLFIPIPSLVISFPFVIVERLISGEQRLAPAYSNARSGYLEDAVAALVGQALPSARTFTNVTWRDPGSGEGGEHDLIAVLGNQILVFEAKSGKLAPAARRGGIASLRTNVNELFLEPGRQASRLGRLLASGPAAIGLLRDRKGRPIGLDPGMPYVVHGFGICLEHLPPITTGRRHLRSIGLDVPADEWAPIISLGELRMIAAFLDSEVSFFHYLTRRSAIEDQVSLLGDEQDLLSMYLVNGFCIDVAAIEGREVMLFDADAMVRGPKVPRIDRRSTHTPGVMLPPFWRLVIKEIYEGTNERRFSMIEVIMNQRPPGLTGMARRMRDWRSGAGGGGSVMMVDYPVARRTFLLVVVLMRDGFADASDWLDWSRGTAAKLAGPLGATDCLVLLRTRRSPSLTYDGLGFFRFPPAPARSPD